MLFVAININKLKEKNYNTHKPRVVTKLWNPTWRSYTIRNQQYRLDFLHLVCLTLQKNNKLCASGKSLINNSKDTCEG